jgi:hypothetical protein
MRSSRPVEVGSVCAKSPDTVKRSNKKSNWTDFDNLGSRMIEMLVQLFSLISDNKTIDFFELFPNEGFTQNKVIHTRLMSIS